jgi:signal transduction histidine kinase
LDDLVAEARAAGLDVELVHSGDVRELPPGLDLTAYRIVQEALTNVRKHAGPVAARVVLHQTDDALDVEVVNAPGAQAANGTPGGHGLIGMRERVRLFEGTIETGPHKGGFRVHVRLPRPEPVA